jgi:mono/diheme cytochrome c family protein
MKRLALLALFALSACQQQPAEPKAEQAKGAPPPPPPYQMRPEPPTGNRLAAADGQRAFEVHCGYCHLAGGMGTNLLTKQRIALGEGPEMALLSNRTDLTPDYVSQVVRQGKNAMPPQTRVDITDAELAAVSAYLGKRK